MPVPTSSAVLASDKMLSSILDTCVNNAKKAISKFIEDTCIDDSWYPVIYHDLMQSLDTLVRSAKKFVLNSAYFVDLVVFSQVSEKYSSGRCQFTDFNRTLMEVIHSHTKSWRFCKLLRDQSITEIEQQMITPQTFK